MEWNSELAKCAHCANYETGKSVRIRRYCVLPDALVIRGLEEGDGYKSLAVLEPGR